MPETTPPSINSGLEEELFYEYSHDRKAVDASWMHVFEGNGHTAPATTVPAAPPRAVTPPLRVSELPPATVSAGDQLVPLRGPALRIAENMIASLSIPVATSQRVMPAKVMDENRRTINQHRAPAGLSKISFTHLVAWGIVRALEKMPALNQAYSQTEEGSFRVTRSHVNFGIA